MIFEKLLHIHVPRTGGEYLRGLLANGLGLTVLEDLTHQKASRLRQRLAEIAGEEIAKAAKTIVVVRNPWDWYVSRYFFRKRNPDGFRNHLEKMAEALETDPELRTGKMVTLSTWHAQLADEQTPPETARFESLVPDLAAILPPILGITAEEIRRRPDKVNASDHPSYRELYDDRTKDLVAQWDGEYIERFGYSF